MRFILAATMVAGLFAWGAARAELADQAEHAAAAKAMQTSCVARGEKAEVCACGVGLAYAQLDPRVFKLVPEIEPLLDKKDKAAAMGQLLSLASDSGLGLPDLMSAYETIKANKETVRQICKPLAG